jgi:hypothetical protein
MAQERIIPFVEISQDDWAEIFYEAYSEAGLWANYEDGPSKEQALKAAAAIMRMINSPVEEVPASWDEELFT